MALPSLIKNETPSLQATLLIGAIQNLGIRTSQGLTGVFKQLLTLNDQRTDAVLVELMDDGIVSDEMKAQLLQEHILKIPIDIERSQEILNYIKKELSYPNYSSCKRHHNAVFVNYAKLKDTEIRRLATEIVKACIPQQESGTYFDWLSSFVKVVRENKLKELAYPLVRILLREGPTVATLEKLNPKFNEYVLLTIETLGELKVKAALEVLKSSDYYNNRKHLIIAQKSRMAVMKIEEL